MHYQVRRINHHPSLALWAGNNEIELVIGLIGSEEPPLAAPLRAQYEAVFLNVLLHAVWDNTRSISYSPSSTTNGYKTLDHSAQQPIVERYNDLTAGSVYGNSGTCFCFFDVARVLNWSLDYYNYDPSQAFNLSTYPVSRFTNEFGFHSQPSIQTWSGVLPSSELHFNSSTILARNHHYPLDPAVFISTPTTPPAPSNQTDRSLQGMGEMSQATLLYYPTVAKTDPSKNFSAQIYATQIFQSEFYRSQISYYRRGSGLPERNMGSLYWQLNDIWAAPTWASVEVGGRWKMLHYGARDVYEPVVITPIYDEPSGSVVVAVSSDLWSAVKGTAALQWYDWSGKQLSNGSATAQVSVGAINSTTVWSFNTKDLTFPLENAVAMLNVSVSSAAGKKYTHTNRFHPIPFSSSAVQKNLPDPKLHLTAMGTKFVVQSQAVAAFVWLEHPTGVRGYFSENGFWMLPGKKEVTFVVQHDTTGGKWAKDVTIKSIWDLTQT